ATPTTNPNSSEKISQHGKTGGIKPEPASNGCSQPKKPAPNSAAPIQPPPKSQNHCDEPLGVRGKTSSRPAHTKCQKLNQPRRFTDARPLRRRYGRALGVLVRSFAGHC